jgi:NADPH:quinone reductase-like Zn-dependent oxidoreductase
MRCGRGTLGRTHPRGTKWDPQTLPLTPGSDVSGTVDALGPEVTAFNVGDQVYGLTNEHFTGGYAEYALASQSTVTKKRNSVGFIDAASVPVVAVTAWQMLFEYAHVISGQSVLIQGAAGSVGAYAVQMARDAGLEIFATAALPDLDYVRGLGARTVIDYHHTRFEDVVPAVDIVLDLVGSDTAVRSIAVLKRGGVLVSPVSAPPAELTLKAGVRAVFFFVDVTTARLNTIAKLLDSNRLVSNVGTVLALADAHLAHEMLSGSPHARGKIVLNVGDQQTGGPSGTGGSRPLLHPVAGSPLLVGMEDVVFCFHSHMAYLPASGCAGFVGRVSG